MQFIIRQN